MLNRKLALVLGTVALAAPALAGCGFDAATDRPYTPAVGVNEQTASVDILGAVVVSAEPGSGTFIASFANEEQGGELSLDSLSPASGSSIEAAAFTPIAIPAGSLVNLAEEGGVEVTGEFEAGNFVGLTLGFSNGERVTMPEIPVVPNTGDYAGLDGEAPAPTEEPSATETAETETE